MKRPQRDLIYEVVVEFCNLGVGQKNFFETARRPDVLDLGKSCDVFWSWQPAVDQQHRAVRVQLEVKFAGYAGWILRARQYALAVFNDGISKFGFILSSKVIDCLALPMLLLIVASFLVLPSRCCNGIPFVQQIGRTPMRIALLLTLRGQFRAAAF